MSLLENTDGNARANFQKCMAGLYRKRAKVKAEKLTFLIYSLHFVCQKEKGGCIIDAYCFFVQKKIVVKVGTNVITRENGLLDLGIVRHLVEQIVVVQKKGYQVILVSSGAMGAGQGIIKLKEGSESTVVKRQVLASVGQIKLMETYLSLFQAEDSVCAQVLVTKEDFRDRTHYLNMKNCFKALLGEGIAPIVNENDVISVDELMFTDNDELAGLIASMMDAETLVILSNVEGIYDRNPTEAGAKVLHKIEVGADLEKNIVSTKSSFGRGGMLTKAKIAERMASMGIPTIIANGQRKNVLLDVLSGKEVGSTFVAKKKKVSGLKRWVASSEGQEKGVVVINAGAEKILCEKIASLLPVGIVAVEGDFQKGDAVKIHNEAGEVIGYGVTSYGSDLARKLLGKRGGRALVHYDYLFLTCSWSALKK